MRAAISLQTTGTIPEPYSIISAEFMQALLLHFRQHGKKAIEKVARNQPGVYLKILALLVPREMQIEHTNRIKQMTDEEIEQAIELIQTMLAARAGEAAKVIEGTAPNGPPLRLRWRPR